MQYKAHWSNTSRHAQRSRIRQNYPLEIQKTSSSKTYAQDPGSTVYGLGRRTNQDETPTRHWGWRLHQGQGVQRCIGAYARSSICLYVRTLCTYVRRYVLASGTSMYQRTRERARQLAHCAAQPRLAPPQNRAQREPNSMKNRVRAHLGQHLAAKRSPRAPKMRPRRAQEVAKSAQERPKSAQEPPKRRPGDVQTWQKSAPERSRTSFSCALSRKPCPGSCWTDFCMFFASRARWPTCSNVRFVPLLPVFFLVGVGASAPF